jgi:hypothetical protein
MANCKLEEDRIEKHMLLDDEIPLLKFRYDSGKSIVNYNKKGEQQNELSLLLLEKAHKLFSEKYYHYQKIGIGRRICYNHISTKDNNLEE